MVQRLLPFVFLVVSSLALRAQNTISTQTLGVTSICPGSTISVPFTLSFLYMKQALRWLIVLTLLLATVSKLQAQSNPFPPTNPVCPNSIIEIAHSGIGSDKDSLVVQLSDGGNYYSIPTVFFTTETRGFGASLITKYKATIPGNTLAGTYSVRFASKVTNYAPSATKLTVKTKPAPPTVDAVQLDCQRRTANDAWTYIYLKKLSGATARIYDRNQSLRQEGSTGSYDANNVSVFFQFEKGVDTQNNTYRYPLGENTYFLSQMIDGCESDRVQTILRTLYRPGGGPTPVNYDGSASGGKLTYCQGEKSYPLNVNGHSAPPENYRVSYSTNNTGTNDPPIPDTNVPSNITYSMLLIPIDGTKGCISPVLYPSKLNVIVNPRPTKPNVSANTISLCQFQQASPLAASATDGASLVWYGTNPTGGTGSTNASSPSTANAGTFKYYVAQKLNDCESERTEITVEVKAASPAPTVSAVSYCQGAPATQLSAVAASGGSLTWYAAPSGGTGLAGGPTPLTNNVGTVNYYVSQTVSGSCESQRVTLPVTVNLIPSAPTVNNASVCQFSTAQPLTAAGQNLKWYDAASGGEASNSIRPNTGTVGSKSYYVSQTVSNCEGPRTAVNVTIKEAPTAPTPVDTVHSFCFGSANAVIKANLNGEANLYTWYGNGGQPTLTNLTNSGSTLTANVPTNQTGTFTYWVTRTVNGCESPASRQIKVIINAVPQAPAANSVAVCQNTTAPVLQATGQNLLWYAANTGGTGSATTPVVSTSQASSSTYYVSQSLNGCDSPRSALTVTVHATPGVPTVEATGPVYCQNASAVSLTATGQELKWYRESSGGTSLGDKPIPDTKTPGSFSYYVSQTINGCEGSRSSTTIKINPAPVTPSVTSTYSYCQKVPASVLSATGNGLKWYDGNNKVIETPTPSTDTPGTAIYFVTQSADNCESARAEIKVTTKPIPGAPATSAISVCQNDAAQTLSANGQNLLWYTAESGGAGSSTTPTVNTGQSAQINYYVSQSLDGCEGPRAALSVTVKPLPAAPGVAQKDICQFAKAEPLTAQGNDLRWYYPDDKPVGATPTPPTERGATYPYKVSQVVNGCEGPKATLTVNVLTTPAPTVSRPTVEVCVGSVPQPLQATGTNLKWTDPAGNVTTITPAPPTLNATTKPDGDVFYVTQTGANGCESPRVAISVYVQTTPTMSIIGTATTNLGLDVPLKLTFTGVGPYRYRLSDGSSGTAIKDTTIIVSPTRSTTYQVVEVANKCGFGLPGSGAAAVVTVNIPRIQTLALASTTTTTLCAGTSLSTNFATSGVFNPGSVFKLQYAKTETDSTKANFVDVPGSQATNDNITGVLPATVPSGTYWVRVVATNPKIPILGNISPTLLTVRSRATGTLTGAQTIFEGQPAKLSVAFTGDGPWNFIYQDSTASGAGMAQTISTNSNPYVFEIRPAKTTAYFLTTVGNSCGNTTPAKTLVVVNVAPVLGIEDQILADAVEVFPVPTTTTLTVRINGLSAKQPAILELVDLTGHTTIRHETRRETSVLTLDQQPAGTYMLRIRVGDRTASKRILKL